MQRIEIQVVAVIFVENKCILPKDMTNTVDKYFFTCLLITKGEKNAMEKIISFMYKDNMQIRKKKDLSTFHKVDLILLWFFNIVSYRRCLVFACFIDDSAFGNYIPDIFCYNNYLYSSYKGINMRNNFDMPN